MREYRRMNRCPFIPKEEWAEPVPRDEQHINGSPIFADDDPCPGAYARSPCAEEAERARKWADKGQLVILYPSGIPENVIAAVEYGDGVLAAWKTEGIRRNKPTTPT